MKKVLIYCLKNPITNEIRYVGKTSRKLCQRLGNHIYNAKYTKHNKHLSNWILSLLNQGLKPIIEILDECNEYNWQDMERYWIKYFPNLINYTDGGDGCLGFKHSQETINKLKNKVGKKHTEEFKKALSERSKSLERTGEWCNNISKGNRGKILSMEHKRALSDSHKNYVMPDSQKEKIRQSLLGKNRPKKVIDKIIKSKQHAVIIENTITGEIIIKENTKIASEYCNCHIETLYSKIKTQKLINNTYFVKYK